MEKRYFFPTLMFLLAGASFLFGGWQYFHARSVQAASQSRMAFIITTIEKSGVSVAQKQELYATIMKDLPAAPSVLGLDFSGSYARVDAGDACSSEGQRAVCRALTLENTDATTTKAVCGVCNPQ